MNLQRLDAVTRGMEMTRGLADEELRPVLQHRSARGHKNVRRQLKYVAMRWSERSRRVALEKYDH
jgi:hypothetical protein